MHLETPLESGFTSFFQPIYTTESHLAPHPLKHRAFLPLNCLLVREKHLNQLPHSSADPNHLNPHPNCIQIAHMNNKQTPIELDTKIRSSLRYGGVRAPSALLLESRHTVGDHDWFVRTKDGWQKWDIRTKEWRHTETITG